MVPPSTGWRSGAIISQIWRFVAWEFIGSNSLVLRSLPQFRPEIGERVCQQNSRVHQEQEELEFHVQ
jgi:hypothetical protein